jgi:hypothetical protein
MDARPASPDSVIDFTGADGLPVQAVEMPEKE